MKTCFTSIWLAVFSLCISGMSQAALINIGTANYGGSDCKLIWDDDNNGNSVVWLDYTNGTRYENWTTQNAWATSLSVTMNLLPAYSVVWTDPTWRLPATVGGGMNYNITTSEMGHLFYVELGNVADDPAPSTGPFDNLDFWNYWSCTPYSAEGYYYFQLGTGFQNAHWTASGIAHGLAIRTGEVTAVPAPTTIWLLGSGLVGLLGIRRKRRM